VKSKRTVVIGMLGASLDAGKGAARWEKWRPSVALCQHENLLVSRFELLTERRYLELAERVAKDIELASPETKVEIVPLELENPWDFEEVYGVLHDFARAYPFAPEEEEVLAHITTGTHVAQICMFLLTEARYIPGRLLQTSPPGRGIKDPAGSFTIIDLDLSRYDRIASRFQKEQREGLRFLKSGIDTKSTAYNAMIERLEAVAGSSRAPILLLGPTGAGKSRLARRIYELKKARRQIEGAFVELNCATLRGDGAMSALFGHKKGAFTGALSERPGLLKRAHRGLLFLDEIGELGADEQAMLLRAIEEKVFLPMGSDEESQSDFQLLAGTNRDLWARVREGRFREDLLCRINLWTFELPSLKDRWEDIAPNLDFELEGISSVLGARVTMSREARELFLRFAKSKEAIWSGNFRDLNAAVTRMATLSPGGRISVEVVEEEIERLRRMWQKAGGKASRAGGGDLVDEVLGREGVTELDPFDRAQLEEVLRVCARSRSLSEAGRTLFAVSRTKKKSVNDADRLRKYLERFSIDWEAIQRRAGAPG